jgi:hypothetical protein
MTPPIVPERGVPLTAEPLWMMHVIGPDDIYPAPDHATAVQWCAYLNSEIAPKVPDVLCVGVPAIWTGTADEHAEGLAEAINGWTVPAAPALSTAETVVVPVEPTEAMLNAWTDAVGAGIFGTNGDDGKPHDEYMRDAYRAMLSAAPAREPEGGAVEAFDRIHRFAVEFNPEMHDIDQVLSEINQTALAVLTPKEAPADPCASHKAEGIALDPCCPHCESPAATGAGEDGVRQAIKLAIVANVSIGEGRFYGIESAIDRILFALRAQPQARSGDDQ